MLGGVNTSTNVSSVITSGPNLFTGSISNNVQNNSGSSGNNFEQNLELLFNLSTIEAKDEFDEKMCRTYLFVQNSLLYKSENQAHEDLIKMSRESETCHDDVSLGLVVSMLLHPDSCQRYYRDLIHITRDGMTYFNYILQQIINEKYPRLHDHSRKQLLWLLKELLRNQVPAVANIYYNMYRNMVCGDQSPKNLWLIESVLDILIELRHCYDQNIQLLTFTLFKYLRLAIDHVTPVTHSLHIKESKFCSCLLQEHFSHFISIGRDLVRLLQQVSRLPDFEVFWKNLLNNPTSLAPNFTGITQLMKIRTNHRIIRLLVTHDMDKKLSFLTSQVHLGHQRRYQDWFQKQYLYSVESSILRSDLIRFICCCIHPSNETIASDVIQRWAVIGWILNTCPTISSQAYAKLALFYDWFFFDVRDMPNNSIMDIEPGILIIYFSLRNYPIVTCSLLDFLCRISSEFYPPIANQIKTGIRTAIGHLCEKRVISSLNFLSDSPKIDNSLRQLVLKTFPDLFTEPSTPFMPVNAQQSGQQTYVNQSQIVGPNRQYFSHSMTSSSVSSASTAFTVVLTMDSIGASSATVSTSSYNAPHFVPIPSSTTNSTHASLSSSITYPLDDLDSVGEGGCCTNMTASSNEPPMTTSLVSYSNNNNTVIYSSSQPYTITAPSASITNSSSSTTMISAPAATIIVANNVGNPTTVCFSDDEDDPPTNSAAAVSGSGGSGGQYFTQQNSKTKKLKKSNSFSGKSSSNSNVSLNNGQQKPKTNVTTVTTNSVSGAVPASISTPPNTPTLSTNPDYIANILSNNINSNSVNNNAFLPPTTITVVNANSLPNNGCNTVIVNDIDNGGDDLVTNHQNTFYNNFQQNSGPTLTAQELTEQIEQIHVESIKKILQQIQNENSTEKQYEIITELAEAVMNEDPSSESSEENDGSDFNSNLTIILLSLFEESMSIRIFPFDYSNPYSSLSSPNENEINHSISGPIFALFEALTNGDSDENRRLALKTLVCEMGTNNSRVGFFFLYYLAVKDTNGDRMLSRLYRDYVRFLGKELLSSLLFDMNNCAHHDLNMFFYLLPHIYSSFNSVLVNNTDMLSYIVAFADFNHMQFLLTQVLNDSIKIFKKESIFNTLVSTLDFPIFEQNFLWQLLDAHDIPLESFISILGKLESNSNSVAMFNLLQILKREEPSSSFLRHLFKREIRDGDNFTVTVLLYWAKYNTEKLAESIGNYVSQIISSPNKRNKRTINNVSKTQINKTATVDQILYYLDEMRKSSKNSNFFTHNLFIVVLVQLIQLCSASQKSKYSELFSSLPEENESSSNSSRKSVVKKNQNKAKTSNATATSNNNNSDTESDSSEDGTPQSRSKTTRKKRKSSTVFDSD